MSRERILDGGFCAVSIGVNNSTRLISSAEVIFCNVFTVGLCKPLSMCPTKARVIPGGKSQSLLTHIL